MKRREIELVREMQHELRMQEQEIAMLRCRLHEISVICDLAILEEDDRQKLFSSEETPDHRKAKVEAYKINKVLLGEPLVIDPNLV